MTREQRNIYNEIHATYGWAVSAQYKALLDGESFTEQNPNALRYIADVLEDFAFTDDTCREMLEEIRDFLECEAA